MLHGHTRGNMNISIKMLLLACLFFASSPGIAQKVRLESPAGNTMIADYLAGKNDKNPVLILHGFLQTHNFSTVSRLATALNEYGYTVLSPSLSLGISNRKQSLSCEAVHTHSMDSDAAELGQWIQWLYKKTAKPVTLIGHSAGGPTMLKYMEDSRASLVGQTILISLSYYASGPVANETAEHAKIARKAIRQGADPLYSYALSYCKSYPTSASTFLSYYDWDRKKVSSVVKAFNDKITIIIGTGDKRIDDDWLNLLQNQDTHVIPVEGANHFFDQAHEFDLLDAIETVLAGKKDQ